MAVIVAEPLPRGEISAVAPELLGFTEATEESVVAQTMASSFPVVVSTLADSVKDELPSVVDFVSVSFEVATLVVPFFIVTTDFSMIFTSICLLILGFSVPSSAYSRTYP